MTRKARTTSSINIISTVYSYFLQRSVWIQKGTSVRYQDQIFDEPEMYEEVITEILAGQQADIEADGKEEADDILMIFSDLVRRKEL